MAVLSGGSPGACDYKDEPPALLQIVSPESGAIIRDADDVDEDTQGIQIDVVVEGEGDGHVLELERGFPAERIATTTLENGRATFMRVSLFEGTNSLQVRDPRRGRSSLPINVHVQPSCRKIFFIEPMLPLGASELVLGPLDDNDGTACGDSLSVRLIAATGLPDGSVVTLFAGPHALITAETRGGVLQVDRVVFDKATLMALGKEPFELVLRVMGSACPDYGFEARVRIDCEGPPQCSILPLGVSDFIGPTYDLDATTPGVQLNVRVASSDEAIDQPVELSINDVPVLPSAFVEQEGEAALALFEGVSLPEGDVRLDAVCRDAVQNLTAARRRSVTVDSLGCPVTITSPALDTTYPGTAPEAMLTATIAGGDCASWFASVESSAACAGLFTSEGEPLAIGQSSVSTTLGLTVPGPSYLCVGARDSHGNESQAAVRVVLEEP
jgi:hypothetical protein